jgi:glycosyltransferase involved in cell wall biosynthesis
VTISQNRKTELVGLYQCAPGEIRIIYNGVDAAEMFGLTAAGWELIQRLELLEADLIMLMPVRVTRAKNIEFALEVVAALKANGLKVKLVLTGPPDPHDEKSMAYFHSLQKLRDELGLHSEMHFVFESGPEADKPLQIGLDVVAGLYRVADLMFMPSQQEGFGMPVLEAGLLGKPVIASEAVPAAEEIGAKDVLGFGLDQPPQQLAQRILDFAEGDKRLRLARRARQNFTWQAIFQGDIEPLLVGKNRR